MNSFAKNLIKLGISGAVIFGIGFAFLTLYPTKDHTGLETKSSEADIASFSFMERTNTEKFEDSLERIGHTEPREYDMNGNKVFFSTYATTKSPREVLEKYQRTFVEEGLNSKIHIDHTPPGELMLKENMNELAEAAAKAEIIPYKVSDHHVIMGGAKIDRGDNSKKIFAPENQATFADGVAKLVRNRKALHHSLVECGYGDQIGKVKPAGTMADVMKDARKNVVKAAGKKESCGQGSAATGQTCNELRNTYDVEMKKLNDLQGIVARNPAATKCPAVNAVLHAGKVEKLAEFEEAIQNYQTVEAYRRPGTTTTQVTATWSENETDGTRLNPNRHGFPEDVDGKTTTLPKCDSCRRTWVFNGNGEEDVYGTEILESHESPALVEDWYNKRMTHEGWQKTEATDAIKELERLHPRKKEKDVRWMHFVREDNTFMTVRIRREDGKTKIIGERTN